MALISIHFRSTKSLKVLEIVLRRDDLFSLGKKTRDSRLPANLIQEKVLLEEDEFPYFAAKR